MKKEAKEFMKNTLLNGMSMDEINKEAGKQNHCTVCGEPFTFWDVQESLGMEYFMGFGSRHDGDHIKIDFCINCFDNLIDELAKKCKISPFVTRCDGDEYDDEDDDGRPGVMTEDEVNELIAYRGEPRKRGNKDKNS